MPKILNLINRKFGRLTVVKYSHQNKLYAKYWECKCNCGKKTIVRASALTEGTSRSCGCWQKELMSETKYNLIHGMTKTKIYRTWQQVKERCLNEKNQSYKDYGGRGIKICNRWLKFENFRDDMYKSCKEHIDKFGTRNTALDRINNNGNYCLNNCRWATQKEQGNNRRNNNIIVFNGKTQNLSQWAEELKMDRNILNLKLYRGWSIKDTLTTPIEIIKAA